MHFNKLPSFLFLLQTARSEPLTTTPQLPSMDGVLDHVVIYQPLPPAPEYKSDDSFNARGMEHVYLLTNTFLDLIQRDDVLPKGINTSMIISAVGEGPNACLQFLKLHWQDFLFQYIGVLTTGIFGLLLAIILPLIGLFFCCCRCAGKCGAYPDSHYDKRSDACKRFLTGVLLSTFVIAAMFGAVCAFVTNHYTFTGWTDLTRKMDTSLDDAGEYFKHTGGSVEVLLVTNFAELEEVVNDILDESGPTLKKKLANITEAFAIETLNDLVSGLRKVKRNLRDISDDTNELEAKVAQLQDGLSRSQKSLSSALEGCNSNQVCEKFLNQYNLDKDLAMADDFLKIKFRMPAITNVLSDISDLIENNIEEKVLVGKAKFDEVEKQIEQSIEDIKPKVKSELRQMGVQLQNQNNKIKAALQEVDLAVIKKDIPKLDEHSLKYVEYRYYVGLVMSSAILMILLCFILGLFYGMCGKRPGGLYGDDCCNRGTGASFLVSGIYFTFFFSFLLLLLTTLHFLVGAAVDKSVCKTLLAPHRSDVFVQLDKQFLQPKLNEVLNEASNGNNQYSASKLISDCHTNDTIYNILNLESVYNITELTNWRSNYGIGEYIENLKNKIQIKELSGITLLTPETTRDLEELARSGISDMDFSKFTEILEDEITKIDLRSFIRHLRTVREQVSRYPSIKFVATKLGNEALYLENMNRVVEQVKLTLRHLKESVNQLETNIKFNKSSLREAIHTLIGQANRATGVIRSRGPELIGDLTERYVTETVGLIDEYVDRVISSIQGEVGYCAPLSTSYNATVVAFCHEIVDPFNGFWASIGWCFLIYLPCTCLSVSLISLYRKSEGYPGPLVETETQPLDKKRRNQGRGHRRNPSGLPEVTHSRALPPVPGEMVAERAHSRYRDTSATRNMEPPRYTSNPSLNHSAPPSAPSGEYERPPPYYYPGP
eukprot:TRINITY_DN5063_c0_g1_i1.p1 TRINITY_DN5063_c0_g1~~TRINITY_DN5063_c0_g1_i1.p1  ORF type:complete len:942 (-),score=271.59 TRINITY_DN5063_c0_g1_i1:188-3013(-)